MLTPSVQTVADAIATVLYLEGNGSDPRDRGGKHRWGISAKYHPLAASADFTIYDAYKIYVSYIEQCRMLEVIVGSNSRSLGYLHLVNAVNVGPKRAMMLLQSVLRSYSENESLKVDGIFGPQTEKALAYVHSDVVEDLAMASSGFYVAHSVHSRQVHFLHGWLNRVTHYFLNAQQDIANISRTFEEQIQAARPNELKENEREVTFVALQDRF